MTDDRAAEPPRVELNFSRFHPLDHAPLTHRCLALYGGPRRHAELLLEHVIVPNVRRYTHCLRGRHRWTEFRSIFLGTTIDCRDCLRRYEDDDEVVARRPSRIHDDLRWRWRLCREWLRDRR